jgi:hypothetical protein
MPERTAPTSKIQQGQPATSPCGQQRNPLDVAGRINDLVNCYLWTAGEYLKVYFPLAIIAVLLLAIMVFAAYQFLKE